ncbi:MAG: hypothetical protein JNM89_01445 [Hyphomicrobiaceae bacterium]|nr:hypothetical protein [Hyphomicrobiaceae bacterium]
MADLDSISAALEFLRNREAPLPDGVATLLRIAVSDPDITAATAGSTGHSGDTLRRAAGLFSAPNLLDPAAHKYRRLGLHDKALPPELRRRKLSPSQS